MSIKSWIRRSRVGNSALGRLAAIRKGRSIGRLSSDLRRLAQQEGPRGLAIRASSELTRALQPLPPPAAPPFADRSQTHAFAVARSPFFNPTSDDLNANALITQAFPDRPSTISTATWFIPYFEHGLFGGIHTILRFMDWSQTHHGIEHRAVIFDHPTVTDREMREAIASVFPNLSGIDLVLPTNGQAPFMEYDELPPTDIAVATIWHSAYALVRFNATKAKFYFVQDFEPSFYPAGSLWALSEASYRFGFAGLVNTPGLEAEYRRYGNPSISFVPAVDHIDPSPSKGSQSGGPVRIVIYGRPGTDRNAFELIAEACRRVKHRHGKQVQIFSAGEEWDERPFNLEGVVENLGLLQSKKEVHDLYASSDIGLCCMLSKHPSYQPFEYMAAHVAVVSNHNTATTWFLKHEINCLTSEPFPTALAEAVSRLIDHPELRARLSEAAFRDIAATQWEPQFQPIWDFITGKSGETEGRTPDTAAAVNNGS